MFERGHPFRTERPGLWQGVLFTWAAISNGQGFLAPSSNRPSASSSGGRLLLKIKIKKVEGRLYLRSTFKNLLRLFRRNALRHADHYVLIQWG